MAPRLPRRCNLPATSASSGGFVQTVRYHVAIKQRPDQYSDQILDITRVGRKVGKVTRLRKEEMIKYEKVAVESDSSIGMKSGPSAKERETEVGSSITRDVVINQTTFAIMEDVLKNEGNEDGDNSPIELVNVVENESSDEILGLVLSDSDETESSDISLGLVIADSDDDDYDAQENDTACNLVEEPKIPRRILLVKSSKRKEKLTFGFSKFEFKNDTLNLDRFFTYKKLKIRSRRRIISNSVDRKDIDVEVDLAGSALKEGVLTDSEEINVGKESTEVLIDEETNVGKESADVLIVEEPNVDIKSAEKINVHESSKVLINEEPNEVHVEVKSLVEDILEEVFSKIVQNLCISKNNPSSNKETKAGGEDSVFFLEDVRSEIGEACGVTKSDCSMALIETVLPQKIRSNCSSTEMVGKEVEGDKAEPSSNSVGWTPTASQTPIESHPTSLQIPPVSPSHSQCKAIFSTSCKSQFVCKSLPSNLQESRRKDAITTLFAKFNYENKDLQVNTSSSLNKVHISNHPPPLIDLPHDTLSELLTPGCVQLQSYLSEAKVSELDMELLAKLDTSPEVIITEVPGVCVDSENNVIDEEKTDIKVLEDSDDSDSDVVLLSDDETELYSPTTPLSIISSWQSDILRQTWQAWPVPTQGILFHLGLETGLDDDVIKDWYKSRTDQELERLWGEIEKT